MATRLPALSDEELAEIHRRTQARAAPARTAARAQIIWRDTEEPRTLTVATTPATPGIAE